MGAASCAGVERGEMPRTASASASASRDPLQEMADELQRNEAYLQDQRDGSTSLATAVLNEVDQELRLPGVGMAVLEVNATGLVLRVDAQLTQGTHHVFLLDSAMPCSAV